MFFSLFLHFVFNSVLFNIVNSNLCLKKEKNSSEIILKVRERLSDFILFLENKIKLLLFT